MFCQFSVRNYKSIRDEITLSMEALNIAEHKESLITTKDGELYLPLSVLYGPNGGGKSNVLEGLMMLIGKVLRPVYAATDNMGERYSAEKTPIVPFLFDAKTKEEPTEFELFFQT